MPKEQKSLPNTNNPPHVIMIYMLKELVCADWLGSVLSPGPIRNVTGRYDIEMPWSLLIFSHCKLVLRACWTFYQPHNTDTTPPSHKWITNTNVSVTTHTPASPPCMILTI